MRFASHSSRMCEIRIAWDLSYVHRAALIDRKASEPAQASFSRADDVTAPGDNLMSKRQRAQLRFLYRSRRRRPRSLHLETLENRLVLSSLPSSMLPTYVIYHRPANGQPIPDVSPNPPAGTISPVDLRAAYGANLIQFGANRGDGLGVTIAVVDAYDNPGFVDSNDSNFNTSDLALFDAQYGLPAPPAS